MQTPAERNTRLHGWSKWTLLGSVLLVSGGVGLGISLWLGSDSTSLQAPAAEVAVTPAADPSPSPAPSGSPPGSPTVPPDVSGGRQSVSDIGPHPNWHGNWRGELAGSTLVIGPEGIDRTVVVATGENKGKPWTAHCKWTAELKPTEGECNSGYAAGSKSLAQLQTEFESSVEEHRRNPIDFKITDPERARQSFQAIKPGNYRVVWTEGEGDCDRHEMIIDQDTILSSMQCHYGHEVERFTRVR